MAEGTNGLKEVVKRALKFGDFSLTSGVKSRFYFDFESVLGESKVLRQVAQELTSLIPSNGILLAGPAMGAITLMSAILSASKAEWDMAVVQKNGEVRLPKNCDKTDIVLVDDVFSTGSSFLWTMYHLKRTMPQANFVKAIVIMDRSFGFSEVFSKLVPVNTLFKAEDFLAGMYQGV